MSRIWDLFSSRRFQQLAVGLILLVLAFYKVIPQELANLIAGFFGASVVVGSADSVARIVAGTKE